jgi:SSS family solute:Na+ symporter
VLQLKGLGIIVSETSYGSITPAWAIWAGTATLMVYVVVSGLRGSAWTAALKDVMILGVVVAIGVYLPMHYFGGYGPMFHAIERAKPGFLTLPASGQSPVWVISTVLLTAMGFYMWPQYFASVYTARNEDVFRKNAVMLPLYQLVILFVFFAGFAAILIVPGLQGADADLSLLRASKHAFTPWQVGVIGAAGLLTALVPGSIILITATTIIAQSVVRVLVPGITDRVVALVARGLVPVIAVIAAVMALRGGEAIVALLLMGYNFVTQLFPALVLSLGPRPKISAVAAFAGIAAGELTVALMSISGSSITTLVPSAPQFLRDLNVGFVALAVNVLVLTIVGLVARPRDVTEAALAG